jgi:hypothetical protein
MELVPARSYHDFRLFGKLLEQAGLTGGRPLVVLVEDTHETDRALVVLVVLIDLHLLLVLIEVRQEAIRNEKSRAAVMLEIQKQNLHGMKLTLMM